MPVSQHIWVAVAFLRRRTELAGPLDNAVSLCPVENVVTLSHEDTCGTVHEVRCQTNSSTRGGVPQEAGCHKKRGATPDELARGVRL